MPIRPLQIMFTEASLLLTDHEFDLPEWVSHRSREIERPRWESAANSGRARGLAV